MKRIDVERTIGRALLPCAVVVVAMTLSASFFGCGGGDDEVAVATVGPRQITLGEFKDFFARQEPDPTQTREEQRDAFLTSLIHKELLVLAARDLGYFERPSVVEEVENFEHQELEREYLARRTEIDSTVTEQDLRDAFETTKEKVQIRHLVHWSRSAADSARQRIDAGEDFGAVADEMSIGQGANPGGLVDWATVDRFPIEFRNALRDLEVGEVVGPFETVYGLHIIKLEGRQERTDADFESERETLHERVLEGRTRAAHLAMQRELTERYELAIDKPAVIETMQAGKRALESVPADSTVAPPPAEERWNPPPEELDRTLATYEDGRITAGDYRDNLLRRGFFIYQRLNPGAAIQDVRALFFRDVIVREARRLGYDQDPEVQKRVQLKREELAVTELYSDAVLGRVDYGDEDIRAFYDDHPDDFVQDERVRYAYLQVEDASVAEALTEELEGIDWTAFEALRKELDQKGQLLEAKRDTGYRTGRSLPPAMVEAVREMEPMDVGRVLWPDGSQVVFVLIEYQPARPKTFEESQNAAESSVRSTQSEAILNAMLDSLKTQYPVERFPERLADAGI